MAKGSSKDYLQVIALQIYKSCLSNRITLRTIWKSRADPRLVLADDWSRCVDRDDWSVDSQLFKSLEKRTGKKFEIDLFATDINARCKKFFSILASERALGRSAFLQNWANYGNVFACPPPTLIGETLRHWIGNRARGGIIFPAWKTLKSWPLVAEDGIHLNRCFSNIKISRPFLSKGRDVLSDTFMGKAKFDFVSAVVEGSVKRPFQSRINKENCLWNGCVKCVK